MPDIQLIKLSIRRGTDQQRKLVVLEQGEIGFTTDHKRLWVGDGVSSGGHVIGAKIHQPIDSGKTLLTTAVQGDVVYENSILFQLTGSDYSTLSSWVDISEKPDNIYIQRDGSNRLTIAANSLDSSRFSTNSVFNGGGLVTTSSGLSVVPDNISIEVSGSAIRVKNGGIDHTKISSTAFTKGIVGGSGSNIQVDADTSFGFIGTTLTLSALPSSIVKFDTIDPTWVGAGLTYDSGTSTINANISGIDTTLINNTGVIGLKTVTTGNVLSFPQITVDQYGRITALVSSIMSGLSYNNTTSQILSTFNGHPNQGTVGKGPGVRLTTITCTSSNSSNTSFVSVTLSSAGFVVIPGTTSQDGKTVGRFAIPVFTI